MFFKKYFKRSSPVKKNIFTLMSGNIITQGVLVLCSPILTRLYKPEEFGSLAMFTFIQSFLLTLVTGKFENAIYTPKSRKNAQNITEMAIILTTIICCILLILAIMVTLLEKEFNLFPKIKYPIFWIYLLPISVFFSAISIVFNQWCVKTGNFTRLSINRFLLSAITLSTTLLLGLHTKLSGSMIFAGVFSQAVTSLIFFIQTKEIRPNLNRIKVYWILAKKYRNFPLHMIPSGMINTISGNMPILILTSSFGLVTTGIYTLIQRVVGIPSLIIGNAVGEAFREKAHRDLEQNGECLASFNQTVKLLVAFSIIPFVIFMIFATDIFVLIFGNHWAAAGQYAQILAPMFFIRFVTMPVSSIALLRGKTKLDLYWQIGFIIVASGGYLFSKQAIHLMIYFSFFYSIVYIASLYINFSLSKKDF